MEKYGVIKTVGEGSFGKALLCERKTDRRKCIIKEISLKKMSKKEAKQTEQEGTILARLSHPNITTFWETFMTPNAFYIVMEFADSGDLGTNTALLLLFFLCILSIRMSSSGFR